VKVASVPWKLSITEEHCPRPKFFVSISRLQEQWSQPWKNVLGSSLSQDGSCGLGAKHNTVTVKRTKLFATSSRLLKLSSQTQKLSWAEVSVKMLGLGMMMIIFDNIK
jgi:hypothetical protein